MYGLHLNVPLVCNTLCVVMFRVC